MPKAFSVFFLVVALLLNGFAFASVVELPVEEMAQMEEKMQMAHSSHCEEEADTSKIDFHCLAHCEGMGAGAISFAALPLRSVLTEHYAEPIAARQIAMPSFRWRPPSYRS